MRAACVDKGIEQRKHRDCDAEQRNGLCGAATLERDVLNRAAHEAHGDVGRMEDEHRQHHREGEEYEIDYDDSLCEANCFGYVVTVEW